MTMKEFKQGRLATVVLTVLLCAAATAHADIRVAVEESINNAPPKTVVHWFGLARTTRDDGDQYVVTRLDQARTYIINRHTKHYRVVEMQLSHTPGPTIKVKATQDRRNISGWPTRRYRLSGEAVGDLTIDIWATTAIDANLDQFHQLMIRLGNRAGSEWMKAYQKIPGFPILQVVTVQRAGIRLRAKSKVVAFARVEPELYTYAPPASYQRTGITTAGLAHQESAP